MKKIAFLLASFCIMFCSCNDDKEELSGFNFQYDVNIYVADKEGNDLLNPNREDGIIKPIIKLYDKNGSEVGCSYTINEPYHLALDPYNTMYYQLKFTAATPYYNSNYGLYDKAIVDWGNGYGRDILEFSGSLMKSTVNETVEISGGGEVHYISEIKVNGNIEYQYPQYIDPNKEVGTRTIVSTSYLFLVK
ncbi:MAG: hypothetical protein IJ665_03850 [Phocaeicola sp.]|nr:hypothetical protein [Phocaeicola sp.]MBR1595809.1 hypothetical protein [Phocaeicola sp.]